MTNREIRFANRFNTKAKRSRNDWKAKRKDRRQYIFDGNVKVAEYDEFSRCVCYWYIPIGEVTYDKRKSAFMTEDEEEYERWERERYYYEA